MARTPVNRDNYQYLIDLLHIQMKHRIVKVQRHDIFTCSGRRYIAGIPDELRGIAAETECPSVVGADLVFTAAGECDGACP